jgi:hypothetical protein
VRARVEILCERPALAKALAALAACAVVWVLLARPDDLLGTSLSRFTIFALSLGLGVWLPLLARTRGGGGLGEIRREGDELRVVAGLRRRRIPVSSVRGVRLAPAARGASVALELHDGTVIAAAVEDLEDARLLAAGLLRDAPACDQVTVPAGLLGLAASVLRIVATLGALGYYLFVVREAIPGSKPLYGLTALLAALALLVVHYLQRERRPLGPGLTALHVADISRAMRAHVELHARALWPPPPDAPRPRVAAIDEPLAAAVPRLRRELAVSEGYRAAAQPAREQLEQALASAAVPLRERAVALRVLAGRDPGEVKRRIAEARIEDEKDRAFLTAVAEMESDEAALAEAAQRPPDFRA